MYVCVRVCMRACVHVCVCHHVMLYGRTRDHISYRVPQAGVDGLNKAGHEPRDAWSEHMRLFYRKNGEQGMGACRCSSDDP